MVRNHILYHSKILLYWNNDTNIGIIFGMAKCFLKLVIRFLKINE